MLKVICWKKVINNMSFVPCLVGKNHYCIKSLENKIAYFYDKSNSEQKPDFFLNKSRLLKQHRNFLSKERPYNESNSWIHLTEKYQRKLFGRYGLSSNVNPSICFKTLNDVKNQKEYEKVAFPYSFQQMLFTAKNYEDSRHAQAKEHEEAIEKKIKKLEQWKSELKTKIIKKEEATIAARERKERLVEEVRRHFGFKIDSRDERFKELLEQKERELRKSQKEAKRKANEQKMAAKLIEQTSNANKQ